MFFLISKHKDLSFPNHSTYNDFCISFDHGWTVRNNYIYKGLTFSGILDIDNESDIEQYRNIEGTFCIIYFNNNQIELILGSKQKFPLYINNNELTNLYKSDYPINIDGSVIISDNISFTTHKHKNYNNLGISDIEVIDRLDNILVNNLVNFQYKTTPKLYVTGLDTILIASYILKYNLKYELILGEHVEMDHFACHHRGRFMKDFWAYQTIQYYKEPTILLTGAHGDETLLRDPLQALLYYKHFGIDFVDFCQKNINLYQSKHCLKESNLIAYRNYQDKTFIDIEELKNYIYNSCYGDYQHWHLGNTLFYSPFDDLRLLDLSLNLSDTMIRKQLTEGYVARLLIERNRPGLLKLLSPSKNVDYYINLADLYEGKKRLEDY